MVGIILTSMLAFGCSKGTAVSPFSAPAATPAVLASLEVTRVKADGFYITVPKSFKTEQWQGIDSSGWSFKDAEMTVSTESGMYGSDAKDHGYLNFRDSQQTIDGELVQIAAYELPELLGVIDPEKRNYVAARFEKSQLSVSARFANSRDEQLAIQIIESIKFDRNTN